MVVVGYRWLDSLMVESFNCQANWLEVVVGYSQQVAGQIDG